MPAAVDHDARRTEVAKIALRVVAEQGAGALTVRKVAQAAGYSTAIISHYFAGKRDLMLFTYRFAHLRAMESAEQAFEETHDVQPFLESLLPLNAERIADWRLWFSFWGEAISDAEFTAAQRQAARDSRNLIKRAILSKNAKIAPVSEADADAIARRLVTVVVGVATQAVFDPEDWPPGRQCAVIADELASYERH